MRKRYFWLYSYFNFTFDFIERNFFLFFWDFNSSSSRKDFLQKVCPEIWGERDGKGPRKWPVLVMMKAHVFQCY